MHQPKLVGLVALVSIGMLGAGPTESSADSREEATRALKKAATYFREKVAFRGGYAYYYAEDLRRRWGEGEVSLDTILVQPPGTPAVGLAYLKAYEATRDRYYLDAAREAAEALVLGQLQSGGWTQTIHFGPAKRLGKYRKRSGGDWNGSSLDDNQTQSALMFLARVDRALGFSNAEIHEAAEFGLDALLKAQFPNGAFPQVWTKPVEAKPIANALYPEYDWRVEGRVKNYWDYYTLNDGLAGTVSDTLIVAHEVYRDEKYRRALEKLGDFLILAQMPDPQPAWAQQYGYDMIPIWARKFEPPAISGGESQDVMETLVKIARYAGRPKYLEPIPRALDFFRSRPLPDGRFARFIELKTNKPLYMDSEYRLTYDDSSAPSHYGWKVSSRLARIETAYEQAKRGEPLPRSGSSKVSQKAVDEIIRALDDQGRWISRSANERLTGQPKFDGAFRFVSSGVFSKNIETLADYLATPEKGSKK